MFLRLPPFLGYSSHHPRDITLPFTIAYMATIFKQNGREVRVLDLWGAGQSLAQCLDQVHAEAPDVVFLDTSAAACPIVLKCAEEIKKFSEARIISFGSVPTFTPERILSADSPIEVGLVGEVEETAVALLDAYERCQPLQSVAGIAYWDESRDTVVKTASRRLIENLDDLPPIDYGLLNMKQYHMYSFPMPIHRPVRWGQILSSRGCPYRCTHCSFDHRQTFGRPFRVLSPERFVDEMELLISKHRVNAISIEDDVFSLDRTRVLEICDAVERRGIRVNWVAQTRVDLVDRALIKRMKRAGCVGLSFGIESGNDRILKEFKKGFTRAQALRAIKETQEAGLMMRLLFMIGNPTETTQEVYDTIDLARKAKAITIQVHLCTPYPGTSLLGEAESDGKYITDFSSYNKIVHNLSAMSNDELWALQKKFYDRYYFSWHYFKVFARQRLPYMIASARRDIPLILSALWYLVWSSRRQQNRDLDGTFAGMERRSSLIVKEQSGDSRKMDDGELVEEDRDSLDEPAPTEGSRC